MLIICELQTSNKKVTSSNFLLVKDLQMKKLRRLSVYICMFLTFFFKENENLILILRKKEKEAYLHYSKLIIY